MEALSKERELEISFEGRTTGKHYRTPVWFVFEDDRIYLLPVSGSDTNWYRNVQKNHAMSISFAGRSLHVAAKPVTEPKTVSKVIEKFKRRYGADEIGKWYTKLDVAVELPLPQRRS